MKNYNKFFESIILNNIDLKEYSDIDGIGQLDRIYKIFFKEYVHNNNIKQNKVELFMDWLKALPLVLSIPYMNKDIIELSIKADILDEEDSEEDFLQKYWYEVAHAFFRLRLEERTSFLSKRP